MFWEGRKEGAGSWKEGTAHHMGEGPGEGRDGRQPWDMWGRRLREEERRQRQNATEGRTMSRVAPFQQVGYLTSHDRRPVHCSSNAPDAIASSLLPSLNVINHCVDANAVAVE